MARTAVEVDPQLIAFMLPSIPESVPIARSTSAPRSASTS